MSYHANVSQHAIFPLLIKISSILSFDAHGPQTSRHSIISSANCHNIKLVGLSILGLYTGLSEFRNRCIRDRNVVEIALTLY